LYQIMEILSLLIIFNNSIISRVCKRIKKRNRIFEK